MNLETSAMAKTRPPLVPAKRVCPNRKKPKAKLNVKTQAKNESKKYNEVIITSGGRGKRVPKPSPKYMDGPMVSASKHTTKNAEGEDGDEPRHKQPGQKLSCNESKVTPSIAGRKIVGLVSSKRKIGDFNMIDIHDDDDHGEQCRSLIDVSN